MARINRSSEEALASAPIGILMLKLAVPAVAAQVINMLYNIVDRIYIGHIPGDGDLALTGVGVCLPLILIVSAFAALVASGGAPRASIYMGKQDHDTAEKILGGCFALQLAVSALLTAVLLLWSRDLLLAFGASENTIGYAASYMQIYAVGTVFVQLTLGLNAFITAQGFAKIGMRTVLIGAVANIVLDPIMIFGLLGCPAMGISGAAAATVIGQIIAMFLALYFNLKKNHDVSINMRGFRPDMRIIRIIYSVGLPSIIMQSITSVMTYGMNLILISFSATAVTVLGIYFKLQSFIFMPIFGLNNGMIPIIAYNDGARSKKRIMDTAKLSIAIAISIMLLGLAVFQVFTPQLLMLFNASDSLLEMGIPALRTISLSFLFAGY